MFTCNYRPSRDETCDRIVTRGAIELGGHADQTRLTSAVSSTGGERASSTGIMTHRRISSSSNGWARAIPNTMKAAAVDRYGPPSALTLHDVPTPRPGPHEVLIAIDTSGIGSWDASIRDGSWRKPGRPRFPLVPGVDGAGIVAAKGARVRRLRVGDRVFAYELAIVRVASTQSSLRQTLSTWAVCRRGSPCAMPERWPPLG